MQTMTEINTANAEAFKTKLRHILTYGDKPINRLSVDGFRFTTMEPLDERQTDKLYGLSKAITCQYTPLDYILLIHAFLMKLHVPFRLEYRHKWTDHPAPSQWPLSKFWRRMRGLERQLSMAKDERCLIRPLTYETVPVWSDEYLYDMAGVDTSGLNGFMHGPIGEKEGNKMVMLHEYEFEIREYVENLPDSMFSMHNIKKEDVLDDEEQMERLWYVYQKNVTEYGMDEPYAKADAVQEVLGIHEAMDAL